MKKTRDYLVKHGGERMNSGRVEIMDCGADYRADQEKWSYVKALCATRDEAEM